MHHWLVGCDNVQLLKLLERLEVKMIMDVRRKIQKEVTLALAERSRDENAALPTDLWKHTVGIILLAIVWYICLCNNT